MAVICHLGRSMASEIQMAPEPALIQESRSAHLDDGAKWYQPKFQFQPLVSTSLSLQNGAP